MKKILAGILASATMLTMTLGASAATASTDKNVKAAGEVEYDVSVTAPKVELDLILPAKITAALNPYGADFVLDAGADAADPADDVTTTAGIASVAYTITNKSKLYGVYIDATATTTVSGKDWAVKPAAPAANKKDAQLVLAGAADANGLKTIADAALPTASAAADGTNQGVLVLDSTVITDKTAGTIAGQTKMKKFMYLPAVGAAGTDETAAMGFLGQLGTGDDVEWVEDDAINVSLILKISAGGKTFAGGAGGGGTTTNAAPLTALSFANGALGAINFTAPGDFTAASSKTLTGTATQSSGIIQVTPTFTVGAGHTVTASIVSGGTGTITNGTQATITGVVAGTDLVINFATDDGSGNGTTYTLTLTVS